MKTSPFLIEVTTPVVNALRVAIIPAPIVEEKELVILDEDGTEIKPMTAKVASPSGLSVRIEKIQPESGIPTTSLEHAEDQLLGKLDTTEDILLSANKNSPDQAGTAIAISILRSSNQIAARTRRGVGNGVLISPNTYEILNKSNSFIPTSIMEKIGRWTNVGTINHTINVYVGPVDDNTFTVFYLGAAAEVLDGPAAVSYANGEMYLNVLENEPCSLGNFQDYIVKKTFNLQLHDGRSPTFID